MIAFYFLKKIILFYFVFIFVFKIYFNLDFISFVF